MFFFIFHRRNPITRSGGWTLSCNSKILRTRGEAKIDIKNCLRKYEWHWKHLLCGTSCSYNCWYILLKTTRFATLFRTAECEWKTVRWNAITSFSLNGCDTVSFLVDERICSVKRWRNVKGKVKSSPQESSTKDCSSTSARVRIFLEKLLEKMYTLLHGFYKYLVQKDEYCVLILGLDDAGKTVSARQSARERQSSERRLFCRPTSRRRRPS